MDSRRLSSVDEEAKIRNKHQDLLQDYLVLQKECVSKKRKLKEANERKETLLHELRFLKQRRDFLLKIRSQNSERQQENVQLQKTDAKYDAEASRRYSSASEQPFPIPRRPIGSMWNSGSNGKQEAGLPPLPLKIGKKPKDLFTKPKNLFTNGKRAEKRKISWQDQLALKV